MAASDMTEQTWAFDEGDGDRHPGFRSLDEEGEFWCLRCDGNVPEPVITAILKARNAERSLEQAVELLREVEAKLKLVIMPGSIGDWNWASIRTRILAEIDHATEGE